MDTIFQLPLFLLAVIQLLLALLLLSPRSLALPISQLVRSSKKSVPTNTVVWTLAIVLGGLLVSSVFELVRGHERAVRVDSREMYGTIDYLRAQVSSVLCTLNLALLFLGRALADAICAEDHSSKNLDAMKRQVKGLQTEYQRVTSVLDTKGNESKVAGAVGLPAGGLPSEAEALKKQVDRLIAEKDRLQLVAEEAAKSKNTAEASVVAMKSQLKGFDAQFDRILEENKLLKRKLVGHGDNTYAADVIQQQAGKKNE